MFHKSMRLLLTPFNLSRQSSTEEMGLEQQIKFKLFKINYIITTQTFNKFSNINIHMKTKM